MFKHLYQQEIWSKNYALLEKYYDSPEPRLDSVWWFHTYYDPTHTRDENETKACSVMFQEYEKVLDHQVKHQLLTGPRPLPGTKEHREHFTAESWVPFLYRCGTVKLITAFRDLELGPYRAHY
jgi:hypothetical protein